MRENHPYPDDRPPLPVESIIGTLKKPILKIYFLCIIKGRESPDWSGGRGLKLLG